ncbi:MAG: hypothetical protein WCO78_04740 [Candidatus Roizmanbacteria bacterium]
MELSIFLAKLLGLTLVIVSTALIVNKKNVDLLFQIYSHPGAVFLTGIVEIFIGLILVLIHTVWTFDFRSIISAVGWILLLRGVGRLVYPTHITHLIKVYEKKKSVLMSLLIIVLFVGIYLVYAGCAS